MASGSILTKRGFESRSGSCLVPIGGDVKAGLPRLRQRDIPIQSRAPLDFVQFDMLVDGVGVGDGARTEDKGGARVRDPTGIRAVRGGGEIQLRRPVGPSA